MAWQVKDIRKAVGIRNWVGLESESFQRKSQNFTKESRPCCCCRWQKPFRSLSSHLAKPPKPPKPEANALSLRFFPVEAAEKAYWSMSSWRKTVPRSGLPGQRLNRRRKLGGSTGGFRFLEKNRRWWMFLFGFGCFIFVFFFGVVRNMVVSGCICHVCSAIEHHPVEKTDCQTLPNI